MSDLENTAKIIIKEVVYLTLATADKNGKPWCTPVFTAYNDNYEFFWASGIETRHSLNIDENPDIAATIYDSSVPEGEGQAVYMEGVAEQLNPDNNQEGLKLLRARCNKAEEYYPLDAYQNETPVRIYKFTPKNFYVLNPDGDERYDVYADCRLQIKL